MLATFRLLHKHDQMHVDVVTDVKLKESLEINNASLYKSEICNPIICNRFESFTSSS